MEIRKGQKVKVICTEARLKEVGVKQKHIKHILGKIGTVKEVRTLPDMEIPAYFVHMNSTADKRAVTLTEDKAREKEERAAVRQLIRTMSYDELHHIRFYAYGLKLCKK